MIGYTNSSSAASGRVSNGTIHVTWKSGNTCTVTNGLTVLTAPNTTGDYSFSVPDGTWVVSCFNNSTSFTKTVTIGRGETVNVDLTYIVYGIQRSVSSSSPVWTRTDDSANYTATASVGSIAGHSDFDGKPIYSAIQKTTIGTDVMVQIPKFWFYRMVADGVETIKISNKPLDRFTVHGAFLRRWVEQDVTYVGAYDTGTGFVSQSGIAPLVSAVDSTDHTLANFRTGARAKGTGWEVMDGFLISAIRMLYLVEFANNNSQSVIGMGNVSNESFTGESILDAGTCDNVPNLTGAISNDGYSGVVWRGIENLWGNVFQLLDGIKSVGGAYYITNNPDNFNSNDNVTNYTLLGYTTSESVSQYLVISLGFDNTYPAILMPSVVEQSTDYDTYFTDTISSGASGTRRLIAVGGRSDTGGKAGLFYTNLNQALTVTSCGSRLMYVIS